MANQSYAAIYQAREQQSYKMNSSDLCKSVWLSYLRTLEFVVVMRTHITRKTHETQLNAKWWSISAVKCGAALEQWWRWEDCLVAIWLSLYFNSWVGILRHTGKHPNIETHIQSISTVAKDWCEQSSDSICTLQPFQWHGMMIPGCPLAPGWHEISHRPTNHHWSCLHWYSFCLSWWTTAGAAVWLYCPDKSFSVSLIKHENLCFYNE